MGPSSLRRRMRRAAFRRSALLMIALITTSVAIHHGALAMGAEMHHDGAMPAAVEFCLAVLTAVGTAVAAFAIGSLHPLRRRSDRQPPAFGIAVVAARPLARARAGPILLTLLCVSRR